MPSQDLNCSAKCTGNAAGRGPRAGSVKIDGRDRRVGMRCFLLSVIVVDGKCIAIVSVGCIVINRNNNNNN